MIEFKGAYCNTTTNESKSVLVQFDGVLLHVWQMADPFCRLLTSDVFTLLPPIGTGKRCIKLPNGGRIETDDVSAFGMLRDSNVSGAGANSNGLKNHRNVMLIACGFAILSGAYLLCHHLFS